MFFVKIAYFLTKIAIFTVDLYIEYSIAFRERQEIHANFRLYFYANVVLYSHSGQYATTLNFRVFYAKMVLLNFKGMVS